MAKFIRYFIPLIMFVYATEIEATQLKCGADQPEKYLPLFADKNVGLVVNHTSLKGDIHLVDFLLDKKVKVKKIFAPEHGFRGEAAPGEEIKAGVDAKDRSSYRFPLWRKQKTYARAARRIRFSGV